MAPPPKKAVPNGATKLKLKLDRKVHGISSCSGASVHTFASGDIAADRNDVGHPKCRARNPSTCSAKKLHVRSYF
jgi:hypothetical protein